MGKFFNEVVMGMKNIPKYQGRRGSLESLRREYIAALHSEKSTEESIEPADDGVGGKPELVVPVAEDRPKRTRRTRKVRTRKARDK